MQRFDHYQLGRAARPLYQVLLLVLGKVARNPMRAIQLFDCRVSTLAEAQRSPRRRLRDIVGLTWDQSLRCGPRPKQLHGLGNARQIGLHGPFEMVELPLLPAFDRSGIKPSDPDQHIDRTDIFPSRERYLGCLDHAIAELLAIVRLHDVVARVERSLL